MALTVEEAVARVYRSDGSFTTVHGESRWSYNGGVREAIRRSWNEPAEGPELWKTWDPHVDRFWARPPDRLRVERQPQSPDSALPRLRIVNGAEWWTFDGETAEGSLGDPRSSSPWVGIVPDLLDPRWILDELQMEVVGDSVVAGRAAVELHATGRRGLRAPVDGRRRRRNTRRYELWIDEELGVLLRIVSLLDEHPIEVVELLSVEFDEPLDDDLFVFVPPPGVEVRARGRSCGVGAAGTAE